VTHPLVSYVYGFWMEWRRWWSRRRREKYPSRELTIYLQRHHPHFQTRMHTLFKNVLTEVVCSGLV
jgi:hypothetical protein